MTGKQRTYMMAELWPSVCRAQGWNVRDDAKRHELYIAALGKAKRFSAFTESDFSMVKARMQTLAGNLAGAIEDGRPELNLKRQLLWKIRKEYRPCLALYVDAPDTYIQSVIRDKFGAVRGIKGLDDLSAQPDGPDFPSELEQLIMTLSARLNDMRGNAGDSIREMKQKAGLVSKPVSKTRSTPPPAREMAPAGADNCPF